MRTIVVCLALVAIGSSATITRADPHTVQVLSVSPSRRDQVLALRDMLEHQGCLAYCQTASVNRRKFIRLRVGVFASRAAAERYAQTLNFEKGFEGFVVPANLSLQSYGKAFDIVTTPGGIWQQSAAGARRLYPFPLDTDRRDYTPARVAPTGRAAAFYYHNRIIKIDLIDGTVTVLREGAHEEDLFASVIRWSPDGKYLAYLDRVGWELPTALWIMRADGRNHRPLAGDETGATKIKSFHWHPCENRIFYVTGPTYGTVSVGGTLYSTDLAGRREILVAADRQGDTEVVREFRIVGDRLHYRLAHFDTARNRPIYSEHALTLAAETP